MENLKLYPTYTNSKSLDEEDTDSFKENWKNYITQHKFTRVKGVYNFAIPDYLALSSINKPVKDTSYPKTQQKISLLQKNEIKSTVAEDVTLNLSKIFNNKVLVFPQPLQMHQWIHKNIITKNDAIIIDLLVNNNMRLLADSLTKDGIYTEMIPHNDNEILEERISFLSSQYRKIWYLASGIYHIHGDMLPVDVIQRLFDKYDQFYLLVDDSHGLSWIGEKGIGFINHHFRDLRRTVLVASLNKGFGATGEILIDFDQEESRNNSPPHSQYHSHFFTSNLADVINYSTTIHLSPLLKALQFKLSEQITYLNTTALKLGLPIININSSPISFFIAGTPDLCHEINIRMLERGFFISAVYFPVLPINQSGLRVLSSLLHKKNEIKKMLYALKEEYQIALRKRGMAYENFKKIQRL